MKQLISVIILLLSSGLLKAQLADFYLTDFSKADSIAKVYEGYDLHNPSKLAELLTKDLDTEVEKFRSLFKWVTDNISYDLEMFNLNNKKEAKLRYNRNQLKNWQKRFETKISKRIITKKVGLCSGYSKILESMCDHIGIQCTIIEGYGRNFNDKIGSGKINHAWNAVNLNSKWYLVDATWASGVVTSDYEIFIRRFNEAYFLSDPFYFVANHYPKDTTWTLLYEKPSLKEFFNSSIKLSGYVQKQINQSHPENGKLKLKKDSLLEFHFTSNFDKKIKSASLELKGYKFFDHTRYPLEVNHNGELYFCHRFGRKGVYKLLIYLDGSPTFLYDVIVN